MDFQRKIILKNSYVIGKREDLHLRIVKGKLRFVFTETSGWLPTISIQIEDMDDFELLEL